MILFTRKKIVEVHVDGKPCQTCQAPTSPPRLVSVLKDVALEKDSIVNCDETWCKVRKYDRYKKCYIWVLVNKSERTVIFFYEDGSRGRSVFTDFIGDAELRSVMSDGYNAYVFIGDELNTADDKTNFKSTEHQVCLAHSRANFMKAQEQAGDRNAEIFIKYIGERTLRHLTTQRNLMLHFGSDEGAEMAATYHCIISTVKMQGRSVWEYLTKSLIKRRESSLFEIC